MVLPVLAIMDARILGFIKNWTLKIFRILSEDPDEQEGTWNEFCRAPECCIPRGLRSLRLAQSLAEMVAVDSDIIIHQADLGNHDQEVNHARMRHRLDVAQGSTFGFANAAFAHLGQEVGIRHSAFKRKGEKKRRGRRQVQKRKTKCFSAWNAYVKNQPVGTIKRFRRWCPGCQRRVGYNCEPEACWDPDHDMCRRCAGNILRNDLPKLTERSDQDHQEGSMRLAWTSR